jgi:hypothetical protein
MKVKDPKIIMPGQRSGDAERMAVEQIQMENALRANPLFPIVAEMRQQMKQLIAQNRSLTIRLQALMDYLSHTGIILHQEIDNDGIPQGEPTSPFDYKFFDQLIEDGAVKQMPTYGYSAYYVEHEQRAIFLIEMMQLLTEGIKDMKEILDFVRNFNALPGRILPIAGIEFGLDKYLTQNPDKWSDEECDAVAAEFGLQKKKEDTDAEEQEADAESTAGKTAEIVSIEDHSSRREPKA